MRVITGTFKGRRLVCPRGLSVRPTTDRVKEAMFNILGPRVTGTVVLDLCCGTGNLGIEALSRGAQEVFFVDRSRQSLATTRINLERCGAAPGSWSLVQDEALSFTAGIRDRVRGRPWIMLCDPPYASELARSLLELSPGWIAARGFRMAVVETGKAPGSDLAEQAPWEWRRYGKTMLAVVRGINRGDEHE